MRDSFPEDPRPIAALDHPDSDSRRRFIQSVTRIQTPPLTPEIRLHLAHPQVSLWANSEETLGSAGLPPPFWAFAWAGGQAVARYALDHPDLFHQRSILDFAAGCGVAGLAAARAGASDIEASEIDPYAIDALAMNAALNDVTIKPLHADLIGAPCRWDIILAGDVFYEDGAEAIGGWLSDCAAQGCLVLIGDPGRARLPKNRLEPLALYEGRRSGYLEDQDIRRTRVWRFL